MQQAETAGPAFGFTPVVQTRDRCADGGNQAHTEREVSTSAVRLVAGCDFARVQCERGRPGADRNIGENRVERMTQPGSMKGIFRRLPGGTRLSKQRADSLAKGLADRIKPWLIRDDFHVCLCHHNLPIL